MFSFLNKSSRHPVGPIEYLLVGLGNPGREYEGTRHNAGFLAMDYIAEQQSVSMKKLQFKSLVGDGELGGKRVLFMKPSSYMNRSGEAVVEAMNYYKIPIEHVIVLCDDISLDVGRVRVRRKGSDGGQKGLANIIYLTGKNSFPRVRIGVGERPHPQMDLAAWVLSKLTPQEREKMEERYPDILRGVKLIVQGEMDAAMNLLN